jgi:iron complex transport system substrate-binding protein
MKNSLTQRGRRGEGRSPYLFVALIVVVIIGGVVGIEALRRMSSRQSVMSPNLYPESATERARAPFPRQLRDASGQVVTIKARPQRIVSMTLSTDEILLAICPATRIAGFSALALDPKFSNIVAEAQASGKPTVENAEQVLRLEPDLIFVASYTRAETVEQLQAAGGGVFASPTSSTSKTSSRTYARSATRPAKMSVPKRWSRRWSVI